jgi:hypothetical protein
MKRYSTSLIVWEMQINPQGHNIHFTPIRMAIIKRTITERTSSKDVEKL